jgi:DNA-binding NarL/FixJ family response regulator
MSGSPRRTPFVGREHELARLLAHLSAASRGDGTAVLLAGDPGIGKTRLAEELAEHARRRRARVLWGRCSEDEAAPAYWPWVQIIRGCVRERTPRRPAAGLGPSLAVIARLVPEVGTWLPDLPEPPALAPAQARFRLFDAVAGFLTEAARRQPLVLVLDDLHVADGSSLLLLQFLVRELGGTRMLVVGTYRDAEPERGRPLVETIAALSREPGTACLQLDGLRPEDVGSVIERLTGRPPADDVVAAVHRRTAGNPFFVTELARLLATEQTVGSGPPRAAEGWPTIPGTVRAVVHQRVGRLSAACRRLLTAAAVVGQQFEVPVLAKVGALAGERLLDVLGEAEAARLITAAAGAPGRYAFVHALVRQTIYEQLPSARRALLHRRVAEALEELRGADVEPHLAELAAHFVQAAPGGDVPKAVAYATRAGEHAAGLLAYEEAARQYQAALDVLELRQPPDAAQRCALLLALSGAQARAGDASRARAAALQAADLARTLGAAEQLARAALALGGMGVTPGVVDDVLTRLLEEVLERLGEQDSALRARVLARLAMELYFAEPPQRRRALSQSAVDMARRDFALWGPDNLDERLAVSGEMLRLAEAAGDREQILAAHARRVPDLLEAADLAAVDAALSACVRLADELRQPLHRWQVTRFRAMRAGVAGRLAEAEELARQALAVGERGQVASARLLFTAQLLWLRHEQGRIDEMVGEIEAVVAQQPRVIAIVWRAVLAYVLTRIGRGVEARQELERLAEDGFDAIRRDQNWLAAMSLIGEACAAVGDAGRATALYDRLRPHAGRLVVTGASVNCWGPVSHVLGTLAAALRQWDAAAAHFADALETARRLQMPVAAARTGHAYADVLLARGRPADQDLARELAAAALDAAVALGVRHLPDRLRTLLAQLEGGDRAPPLPGGLTAREAEVLRQVAAGMSNREIAAALVVSVYTVERHLVNVYRKIGARARADATAYALRHGIAPTDAH